MDVGLLDEGREWHAAATVDGEVGDGTRKVERWCSVGAGLRWLAFDQVVVLLDVGFRLEPGGLGREPLHLAVTPAAERGAGAPVGGHVLHRSAARPCTGPRPVPSEAVVLVLHRETGMCRLATRAVCPPPAPGHASVTPAGPSLSSCQGHATEDGGRWHEPPHWRRLRWSCCRPAGRSWARRTARGTTGSWRSGCPPTGTSPASRRPTPGSPATATCGPAATPPRRRPRSMKGPARRGAASPGRPRAWGGSAPAATT